MKAWCWINVVPWNSHELEPHTGHQRMEINFDFVESKQPHKYTDRNGVVRDGTLVCTAGGKSYILDNTPDQYPGANTP